jgi:STE24 endopeptidase
MAVTIISPAFVSVYVTQVALCLWLAILNINHVRKAGSRIPPAFAAYVDSYRLTLINAYTIEKSALALISTLFFDLLVFIAVVFGGLGRYHSLFSQCFHLGRLTEGVLFLASVVAVIFTLHIPFSYFSAFVTEQKFGFNRATFRTWAADRIKEFLVSVGMAAAFAGPILWMMDVFPEWWWFGGFVLFSLFEVALTALFPVVIAPLFNEFGPLHDELLAHRVKSLMEKAGLKSGGVYQIDATRRSTHSNAYLAGLGRTRRIVLFDSLLQTHSHAEILAILGHEIGHLKSRHILKSLFGSLTGSLVLFWTTGLLMGFDAFYIAFALSPEAHAPGLLIMAVFWRKVGFFAKPLLMALARSFEREADLFSAELIGGVKPLAAALKKIAGHNLTNLTPHPFYVWFNYSHPPLPERVAALEKGEPPADQEPVKAPKRGQMLRSIK